RVAAREGLREHVISRVAEHAFAEQAVRHERLGLGGRGRIDQQPLHRVGELLGEQPPEARRLIALEIPGLAAHFVEHAPEELGVLRFVGEEGGEEQLLLEALFAHHGHDERQEVAGHALFRGLEQDGEAQQHVALDDGEARPVVEVPPQVEAPRIPGTEPLRFVVQAHRDGVVAQRSRAGRPRLAWIGGGHVRRYCTAFTMSKIGRYMAMTMPPTMTPSTTIMTGSMSDSSALTAASTSSS